MTRGKIEQQSKILYRIKTLGSSYVKLEAKKIRSLTPLAYQWEFFCSKLFQPRETDSSKS